MDSGYVTDDSDQVVSGFTTGEGLKHGDIVEDSGVIDQFPKGQEITGIIRNMIDDQRYAIAIPELKTENRQHEETTGLLNKQFWREPEANWMEKLKKADLKFKT